MIGLVVILVFVLFLPFWNKTVERNLELFLLVMGVAACIVSNSMDRTIISKALMDPINISIAVLIAGLLCKWLKEPIERSIVLLIRVLSPRVFFAITVIILGLASSMITAIIAAIILVTLISVIALDRQSEIRFTILACFSIGLGAALTPIGEPLSTITVSKLNGDFFLLFKLIGPEVVTAVIVLGLLTPIFIKPISREKGLTANQPIESYTEVLVRSFKIYIFVMGLTYLGNGFKPLIDAYILGLQPALLYWLNIISAVLDNATLAAAEISPSMDAETIRAILLGLLISGGMLIPGNIPNIIAAGKLNITSVEWARFGIPIGLICMVVYYIVLFIFQ